MIYSRGQPIFTELWPLNSTKMNKTEMPSEHDRGQRFERILLKLYTLFIQYRYIVLAPVRPSVRSSTRPQTLYTVYNDKISNEFEVRHFSMNTSDKCKVIMNFLVWNPHSFVLCQGHRYIFTNHRSLKMKIDYKPFYCCALSLKLH